MGKNFPSAGKLNNNWTCVAAHSLSLVAGSINYASAVQLLNIQKYMYVVFEVTGCL